ncbi:ABC transporter permease [Kallipyga massiliensis]|uniref:ABC transporter permease n=1 Tax=Kallipyga massiliensis TaxID=1472764 RepID=UPI0004B081CF|nr:ABC transporter permease [Kallipyga massiliensis]
MNKFLKMLRRMILQNKFFTFVLVAEACLTFFIITTSLNRYDENRDLLKYYRDRPILQTSIVRFENTDLQGKENDWKKSLKKLKAYQGKAEIFSTEIEENGELATLTVYDPMTAKIFMPHLSSGRYPSDSFTESGQVIALGSTAKGAQGNSLGEKIPFSMVWDDQEREKPNFLDNMTIEGLAPYLETELLNDGQSFYSGEDFDLKIMFAQKDLYVKHFLGVDAHVKGNSMGFQLYYFDDTASPDLLKKLVDKGKETAPTYAISDLADKTQKIFSQRLINDLPFNLTVGLIFVSGLVSLAILNVKKLLPQFRVYRLCGASRRSCLVMYFGACALLLLFCVGLYILFMLLTYRYAKFGRSLAYVLRWNRVAFLVGLSFVLAALMTLPMALLLKKEIK